MKTQTTMTATMINPVHLLGTSLKLAAGQTVTVTPASNQPGAGKWFAASPEWINGDSILVESDDFRLGIDSQIDSLLPEWTSLVASLIPDIDDDFRASEFDDDTPGMQLTIGFTPETEDNNASWSYQTGDNSYSGGAYLQANWAVVSLYRDSIPAEVALEIVGQLAECFWN